MTTGCRVAVLGAYGAVGRHLVPETKRLGHHVTAVGRRAEQLRAIAADAQEVGSIGDRVLLARLGTDHDVVVNATGVEDAEAAGIVTDAGAAYADISADADHLLALEALQPRRTGWRPDPS